jgi:hypothetical protein
LTPPFEESDGGFFMGEVFAGKMKRPLKSSLVYSDKADKEKESAGKSSPAL